MSEPIMPSTPLRDLYIRLRRKETTRQTGMLFSAQTASMVGGFFASIIQARWMEPAEMGRFAFCLSIVVVTSFFFDFGISSAGGRGVAAAVGGGGGGRGVGGVGLVALWRRGVGSRLFALVAA